MKKMKEVSDGMVKCKRCGEIKSRDSFRPDKVDYNCRMCLSEKRTLINRTPRGLAFKMHATQRRNAKIRNHSAPVYSQIELMDWLVSQVNFNSLMERWKQSGYDKQLVPSCDRIDDSVSYTFPNIELKAYKDNRSKYSRQKIKGIANKSDCIEIYQYDLDGFFLREFHSIADAVRELGLISNAVSKVCKGTLAQHHGWVFRYKSEVSSNKDRLNGLVFKRKPNKRTA